MSITCFLPVEVLINVFENARQHNAVEYVRLCRVCKIFLKIVKESTVVYSGSDGPTSQLLADASPGVFSAPIPKLIIFKQGGISLEEFNAWYEREFEAKGLHVIVIRIITSTQRDLPRTAFIYTTTGVPQRVRVANWEEPTTRFLDHTLFEDANDEAWILNGQLPPVFDHHYYFRSVETIDNVVWNISAKAHSLRFRAGLTAPLLTRVLDTGLYRPPRNRRDDMAELFLHFNTPNLVWMSSFQMPSSLTSFAKLSSLKFLLLKGAEGLTMNVNNRQLVQLPLLVELSLSTLVYGFSAPKLKSLNLTLIEPPGGNGVRIIVPLLRDLELHLHDKEGLNATAFGLFDRSMWKRIEKFSLSVTAGNSRSLRGIFPQAFIGLELKHLQYLEIKEVYNPSLDEMERFLFAHRSFRTINAPKLRTIRLVTAGLSTYYFLLNRFNAPSFRNLEEIDIEFSRSVESKEIHVRKKFTADMFPNVRPDRLTFKKWKKSYHRLLSNNGYRPGNLDDIALERVYPRGVFDFDEDGRHWPRPRSARRNFLDE